MPPSADDYTLEQYVHDQRRMKLLNEESNYLTSYQNGGKWLGDRMAEIAQERVEITGRMNSFDGRNRNPNQT